MRLPKDAETIGICTSETCMCILKHKPILLTELRTHTCCVMLLAQDWSLNDLKVDDLVFCRCTDSKYWLLGRLTSLDPFTVSIKCDQVRMLGKSAEKRPVCLLNVLNRFQKLLPAPGLVLV